MSTRKFKVVSEVPNFIAWEMSHQIEHSRERKLAGVSQINSATTLVSGQSPPISHTQQLNRILSDTVVPSNPWFTNWYFSFKMFNKKSIQPPLSLAFYGLVLPIWDILAISGVMVPYRDGTIHESYPRDRSVVHRSIDCSQHLSFESIQWFTCSSWECPCLTSVQNDRMCKGCGGGVWFTCVYLQISIQVRSGCDWLHLFSWRRTIEEVRDLIGS